jgi:hypothetical protein
MSLNEALYFHPEMSLSGGCEGQTGGWLIIQRW